MPEDPASLQNLHDIVVPKPPPIWPPAPGVWVLLVIGLGVARFVEGRLGGRSARTLGRLTVWVGTQWPTEDRRQIAHALGLPESQVRVVQMATGGAFGG